MTDIIYAKEGCRYQLSISGHSGYAKKGSDIVCAAISALGNSFAIKVNEMDLLEEISAVEVLLGDGIVDVIYDDPQDKMKVAYSMTVRGLECIQEMYSDYVTIKFNNEITL